MRMNRLARALAQVLPRSAPKPDFFVFEGGLDTESSPLAIEPGCVVEAQNYEHAVPRGYRRIAGYERMDGQPKPSDAQYAVMDVTISGSLSVGDEITGATSGATATVIAVVTSDEQDYIVLTKITGTFESGEDLEVSAVVEAVADSAANVDSAATTILDAQYRALAADEYRADITAVPGSGSILGGFLYNDVTYAFRNNAGGTAAVLHKSSAAGWVAVDLGRELEFTSGGTTEIEEGDTITGATSGATGVVGRVILTSGTWAGGDAAGRFILTSQTGTFQAENLNVGASLNLATIAGNSTAITLAPSGRYEFVVENFGGATGTKRVYGVSGVHRGFEFDGTVFVPINTGMSVDTPRHVFAHKFHLFFSFGPSVQHAAPGQPYVWSPVLGASEIAMGDDVTGFAAQPGGAGEAALAIYTRNRTSILYGSGVADWNLVPYRKELGAYPYTIQDVGRTMFADDRGVTTFETTQSFGNFAHAAISDRLRSWFNVRRTLTVASCVSRDLAQYRLFFSDNYALYVTTLGRKVLGCMPILLAHTPTCAWSSERNDGSEDIYFGASDGFVYQMDKGTSFDGEEIEAFLFLPFHHSRSPRLRKRYHGATFEITGTGYAEFSFTFELGYQSDDISASAAQQKSTGFSLGRWDSGSWDTGVWDGRTLLPVDVDLDGTAENISPRMHSISDYHSPFTFHGVNLHLTPRRMLR